MTTEVIKNTIDSILEDEFNNLYCTDYTVKYEPATFEYIDYVEVEFEPAFYLYNDDCDEVTSKIEKVLSALFTESVIEIC